MVAGLNSKPISLLKKNHLMAYNVVVADSLVTHVSLNGNNGRPVNGSHCCGAIIGSIPHEGWLLF